MQVSDLRGDLREDRSRVKGTRRTPRSRPPPWAKRTPPPWGLPRAQEQPAPERPPSEEQGAGLLVHQLPPVLGEGCSQRRALLGAGDQTPRGAEPTAVTAGSLRV